MQYYVTIKVEETLVIDDVFTEAEAVRRALECFDASANDPELVEVWSDEE